MRPFLSSAITFICVFGGAMVGISLKAYLPLDSVSPESKETTRLAIGLVATMATFVLGLLVSSSKGTYDRNNADLTQMTSQMILADRLLAHYGSDAHKLRKALRDFLIYHINLMWPNEAHLSPLDTVPVHGEDLYIMIHQLTSDNDRQKSLRSEALAIVVDIGRIRWLFYVQRATSVPFALVFIMISWLTVVFFSFGVFSPPSWTAIGSLLIAGVCVSAAIFLILEMYAPFSGLIRIPSTSVRAALSQLGR